MSEPKWTPGPWTTDLGPNESAEICMAPDGELIADCYLMTTGNGSGHANARLIAAAPELYEALQAFVNWRYAEDPDDGSVTDAAYAALAKARGESSTPTEPTQPTEATEK